MQTCKKMTAGYIALAIFYKQVENTLRADFFRRGYGQAHRLTGRFCL